MGDLWRYLVEHPAFIWLLGFPLESSSKYTCGFDPSASLPTQRHLTQMARDISNLSIQFLLDQSVALLLAVLAARGLSVGEYYWGYGSGVVVVKVPEWGEFVLAEKTQTFDKPDVSYFFPLMQQIEQRLGFCPRFGTFDAAFDAFYVYEYFCRPDDPSAFAAVPFSEKGGYKSRKFDSDGLPICQAGLAMPLLFTYTDRTLTIIEHERGKYVCPFFSKKIKNKFIKQSCPVHHKRARKGGCTVSRPTSIGARLRYFLDRQSQIYKEIYSQRSATERINSQAVDPGIEHSHFRNGNPIANFNTLTYSPCPPTPESNPDRVWD